MIDTTTITAQTTLLIDEDELTEMQKLEYYNWELFNKLKKR
jgi:hypothetical protein